jgi:hypothetical protein
LVQGIALGVTYLPGLRVTDLTGSNQSLRFRAAVMDPCADFDQTGCAWPRAPAASADAPRQGQLFADD